MIRKQPTDEFSDDNSVLTLQNHFVTGKGRTKSMIDISSKHSIATIQGKARFSGCAHLSEVIHAYVLTFSLKLTMRRVLVLNLYLVTFLTGSVSKLSGHPG
jgi:hypothetical protein